MEANEIVGTTFYTINRLRDLKGGGDMLLLYFSYIEQSRIQETNRTRSLDTFMIKKMGRGKSKFYNAKKGLKDIGLIDIIQVRDNKGQITTRYVKTNFMINEDKIKKNNTTYELQSIQNPENQTLDNPPSGFPDTNALSTKHKCLKNLKEKRVCKKYGEFVTLTDNEYKALCSDYGEDNVKDKIEDMNIYCGSKGKPYKNYNLALRGWLKRDCIKKPTTDKEWFELFKKIKLKGERVIGYKEELGKDRYNKIMKMYTDYTLNKSLNLK